MCNPRKCLECAVSIDHKDARADFCNDQCRKVWNNRRMTRGAELYDLFMAYRYQRNTAKLLGLWSLICRMASYWNEEDKQVGRRSYANPKTAKERAVRYAGIVGRVSRR